MFLKWVEIIYHIEQFCISSTKKVIWHFLKLKNHCLNHKVIGSHPWACEKLNQVLFDVYKSLLQTPQPPSFDQTWRGRLTKQALVLCRSDCAVFTLPASCRSSDWCPWSGRMGLAFKRTGRERILLVSESALSFSPNFHFNLPMNGPLQDGQI